MKFKQAPRADVAPEVIAEIARLGEVTGLGSAP